MCMSIVNLYLIECFYDLLIIFIYFHVTILYHFQVCKERIRILEFMKDYDKLRSGRMLKASFRRALDMARFNLYESEIAILEDK